jgi:hypothetical protein
MLPKIGLPDLLFEVNASAPTRCLCVGLFNVEGLCRLGAPGKHQC